MGEDNLWGERLYLLGVIAPSHQRRNSEERKWLLQQPAIGRNLPASENPQNVVQTYSVNLPVQYLRSRSFKVQKCHRSGGCVRPNVALTKCGRIGILSIVLVVFVGGVANFCQCMRALAVTANSDYRHGRFFEIEVKLYQSWQFQFSYKGCTPPLESQTGWLAPIWIEFQRRIASLRS